jgi:hypothetical protein
MRSTGARGTRLAPVDDEVRIRPIDANERREMLLEERILRTQIQRERASAYWFAATKWGIAGLVSGLIVGGYLMYVAMLGAVPLVENSMFRAQAVEAARTQLEEATGLPAEELPGDRGKSAAPAQRR